MSELIVLCPACASDRGSEACDPEHFTALFDPASVESNLRSRGFVRAFSRARVSGESQDDSLLPRELAHERWLRARFSLVTEDSVEAWSAAVHEIPRPAWRLTPVHIRVGQDQLTVTDPGSLGLAEHHWHQLADAARPAFDDAGMTLTATSAIEWFLSSSAQVPDWRARSWTMACGRSVDAYLPEGGDSRLWRSVFTDVQMLWHDHPVNREREALGLVPVNALWLDGRCSLAPTVRIPTVLTNDTSIAGLARAAGGRALAFAGFGPDAATSSAFARDGDVLVDLAAWRAPRRTGDPSAWREAWSGFDQWIGQIAPRGEPPAGFDRMRAVFTGERRIVELTVPARPRWHFWHRIDPAALILSRG